jgi:DNA-binding XRE family transcriptional regulator
LYVSTIRDTVVCPVCQVSQFERGSGKCNRCQHLLGIAYIELFISSPFASLNSQRLEAVRIEVGGLIRRLRSRRDMTQATLASLIGIHRTYLSRVESGQVVPPVITLIRIAGALGVEKLILRLRSSPNQS